MKAIINTGPGRLEWRQWPLPEPGPGEVRIRTACCGICATDLEMIDGWDRTDFPAIPGHEWAGVIDAVGPDGREEWLARACVAENIRSDGGEVGFEHPGGYGEFLLVDAARVHFLPSDFPLDLACLIEPLAVAVRGLRRLMPESGSPALVLGDGPLGLLLTLLLRRHNAARIVLVGGRAERLDLARKLGADQTLNYHDFTSAELTECLLNQACSPFPLVLEASGSISAIHTALAAAATDARLLMIGDYGDARADFPWNKLLHREWQLIGSNASAGAWDAALTIAAEQRPALASLISHRLPIRKADEGIRLMRQRTEPVLKIILQW